MTKDTGGPAFPVLDYLTPDKLAHYEMGMTLRDWFAGQALGQSIPTYVNLPESAELLAKRSYAVADAMLVERNKT